MQFDTNREFRDSRDGFTTMEESAYFAAQDKDIGPTADEFDQWHDTDLAYLASLMNSGNGNAIRLQLSTWDHKQTMMPIEALNLLKQTRGAYILYCKELTADQSAEHSELSDTCYKPTPRKGYPRGLWFLED